MEWKFTGSEPVYQQIAEHFRRAVLTGQFPAGSRVPSVRELATQARVNPNTMQRALTALEREGLLICHGTLGRFVTSDERILENLRQQAVLHTVRHCSDLLAQLGLTLQDAADILTKEEVCPWNLFCRSAI